uniref:Regulator of chromosome condensation protein n=1 Tax=Pithovirus LCPAC403 TaxID=2506596 RepID=A0A481ZB87_9VIRU|nr:MAG: regulator of chromosome condensation protein [Pithovirus LCPAC403]
MAVYRTFSEVRRSYRDEEIYQVDYFSSIEEARKFGLSSNLINVTHFSLMKLGKKAGRFNEIDSMEGVGDEEDDVKDLFPLRELTREEISELPKFIYLFTHSDISASRDGSGTEAYIDEESLLKNSTDIYDTWKSVLKTSKPFRETYDQYIMFNGVVEGDENFNTFEDALDEILPSEEYRETYMEKYEVDNPKGVKFLEYNFSSKEKLRSVYEFARAYVDFHSPSPEEEKEDAIWYSECSNESDPILLEDFSDLEEKDVVKIFLGNNRKGECYVTNQLLRFWRDPEIIMRNWERSIPNIPIEKSGFKGKPGTEKYYRLPITGSWITYSAVKIIRQKPQVLRLKVKRKNQLIGNRLRSFGASEIHGQSPGVIIWEEKLYKRLASRYVAVQEKLTFSDLPKLGTISAGKHHSVALKEDGSLISWGNDYGRQVSDTPNESDFIQVSAGVHHSVALREDGTIVSWGNDGFNQISDTPRSSDFIQVSAGGFHSIALRRDGIIISWGYDGTNQISDTPSESNFIQVSTGSSHSVALKEDGSIISWGSDYRRPVSDTPDESDFIQVSTGGSHSVALKEDGSLISWGGDYEKQVSDTPNESDFIQVSAGGRHSIALRRNGSLISWGGDYEKQVSDTPNESDFIQVSAGEYNSIALRRDGSLISWGGDYERQVSDTPNEFDFRISSV